MSITIDSDALQNFGRMLGIAGDKGRTLLDNGNVSQVFDLAPVVRRSRTIGPSTGWFYGLMQNVHAGAGELTRTIDPYSVGATLGVSPYPADVPQEWDVWLLQVAMRRTSGAGDLDGAAVSIVPDGRQQGFGVNDSGAAVVAAHGMPVAFWTAIDATLGLGLGTNVSQTVKFDVGLRMGRHSTLNFVSDAVAAATFTCLLTMGLFVGGLGQDVVE